MGSRVVLDGVATWTTFFSIASLFALPQIHTAKVTGLCNPTCKAWTISTPGHHLSYPIPPYRVNRENENGLAVEPNSTCQI
ncbi:hypothetical protein BGZ61DRAFT_10386 [Ilyonectria robusta]|uniref:uncharacterized protein n=1 Tax=Ilyonectria robusta TaxID=1079257 RepID=UPI001E8D1B36|nr:uncharacterized protein BGZ61DRAFT_10386 [Ilyonectria robusta]KAH8737174.1 hypothetical protein BGZ61DRAFT_10386 [Ilyonectria robusta]